jgi:5-methylcytosine-specific restriction protein A
MALSDLTRPSVLKAIAEFDRLGRQPFIEKYGFREARDYFVRFNGRLYDSKPIAAVAHGLLGPGFETLTWHEFSGGRHTVERTLSKLGFEFASASVPGKSKALPAELGRQNPTWTRDELILGLDVILRTRAYPQASDPQRSWSFQNCSIGSAGNLAVLETRSSETPMAFT